MNANERNECFESLFINYIVAKHNYDNNVSVSNSSYYSCMGKLDGFCMALELYYRVTETSTLYKVDLLRGQGKRTVTIYKFIVEKSKGNEDE